ncbi:hypothetical protein ABPG74_017670 [Tetrahymena malaccensis]
MDQSNIQFQKFCKYHEGQQIKFISFTSDQLDLCSKCVTDKSIDGSDLLLVEDLLDACNKEIITNWPPLINQQITNNFENIFNNIDETQENIASFFEAFQVDLIKKISDIRKQVFLQLDIKNNENIKILQIYNEMADKEKLQQLSQDYLSNKDIDGFKLKEFINEMYENSYENEETLNDILDKQFQKSNFNLIKDLKNVIIQITNNIGEMFLGYCQDHKNDQIIKKMKFNQVNLIKGLMDINNTYLNQDEDFSINLQIDKNQICKSSIQIQNNNSLCLNKIFNQLEQRAFIDFQQMSLIQQIQNENIAENDKIISLLKFTKSTQNQNIEIQNQTVSLYDQLKNLQDLTETCEFIQTKKHNNQIHTKFVRDENKILKIVNLSKSEKTEVYYNKILDFPKDYIIQIKLTPFKGFEKSYNYEIGFKKQQNPNEYSYSSPVYFTNVSGYYDDVKGFKINDKVISFQPQMRHLELQSVCSAEQFFIYDFPIQNNISKQRFSYNTYTPKIFYIQFQYIKAIEILSFKEITHYQQII